MSHPNQKAFCRRVRRQFRSHFVNANVVDVGSKDINGSNRWLFRRYLYNWKGINKYLGIDLTHGPNVDLVGPAHIMLADIQWTLIKMDNIERPIKPYWPIDVVISTEALEHDEFWHQTLQAMYNALRPGGLMLITAAGEGRHEHGTYRMYPAASPDTLHHYQNITIEMFASVLPNDADLFTYYFINHDRKYCDFQFCGIKK